MYKVNGNIRYLIAHIKDLEKECLNPLRSSSDVIQLRININALFNEIGRAVYELEEGELK